ncbi:MAG: FecR domain-containing protein [Gammaproteobacteria bacterium]|nr:FecR domain-containing protein [Gammaproteobacteria bacterium]
MQRTFYLWPRAALAAALCFVLVALVPLAAQAAVATVEELDGSAFAFTPGAPMQRLARGDGVEQGAKVVTGADSSAKLVFTDGTQLELGERTTIAVDNYRYAPDEAEDEQGFTFSTSIFAGVVRAVTGLIGKRRPTNVSFRTPVATIGIRGTHFTAEVQGSSATIILLAQVAGGGSNAIEVSNQYGSVAIDEAGYGTEIPDEHSPPSPPRRMDVTRNMGRVLRSLNTTRRVRVPRSPIH